VDCRRLVAHRGYPSRYPENTLVGIEAALRLGAKYVEVDVQLSADGEPVLFHDRDLMRICGVRGAVHERSAPELRDLRAHHPKAFGDQFRDVPLAMLEELVSLLDGHPETHVLVEVKRVAVEQLGVAPVVEAIDRRLEPIADRCTLISFAPEVVEEARRRGWEDLGLVLGSWSRATLAEADALDPGLLACNVRKLPWTGDLKRPGRRLAVYDVVDPRRAERWASRGADLVETFAIGEMLEHFR
jgi:glycerophosphoryl diester phosphodiesterase